jgi:predicted nucleotidyltransferase
MNALQRLHAYLADRDVPHALIGGHALAARGYARFTLDVDILTTDKGVLRHDFWTELRADVDVRLGDPDDPLRGVVRITLADGAMADIVVGKYQWQRELIDRAESLDIGGVPVAVPRSSDLILLKLFAGGPQDLADIRTMLETTHRHQIVAEVRARISALPEICLTIFEQLTKP